MLLGYLEEGSAYETLKSPLQYKIFMVHRLMKIVYELVLGDVLRLEFISVI